MDTDVGGATIIGMSVRNAAAIEPMQQVIEVAMIEAVSS
jgi:hypothetical protein